MRTILTIVAATLPLLGVVGCAAQAPAGQQRPAIVHPLPVSPSGGFIANATLVPVVGQPLVASPGSWGGNPTRFTYQWQDCNSSGLSCVNISGATGSTYVVQVSDEGDDLDTVVVAYNGQGSATQTSAAIGPVAGGSGGTTNCFSSPGSCGYPDPAYSNVGVSNCSSLATQGWSPSDLTNGTYYYPGSGNLVDITANNVTISNTNIGNWQISPDGVTGFTLNNDCIALNGESASLNAIQGQGGASAMTIENSTLVGSGCAVSGAWDTICSSSGVNESLLDALGNNATITNNIMVGSVEPINGATTGSVITGNYVVANGYEAGAHTEDIYESNASGVTIHDNVLYNPWDQSAVIYGDTPESCGAGGVGSGSSPCNCVNNFTITGNLLAGGGYVLQECSQAYAVNTATMTFTGNDVGRCLGTSTFESDIGGDYCAGGTAPGPSGANTGYSIGSGQDTHGYWPNGGFFSTMQSVYCSGTTYSANTWDNDGSTFPESCT